MQVIVRKKRKKRKIRKGPLEALSAFLVFYVSPLGLTSPCVVDSVRLSLSTFRGGSASQDFCCSAVLVLVVF